MFFKSDIHKQGYHTEREKKKEKKIRIYIYIYIYKCTTTATAQQVTASLPTPIYKEFLYVQGGRRREHKLASIYTNKQESGNIHPAGGAGKAGHKEPPPPGALGVQGGFRGAHGGWD